MSGNIEGGRKAARTNMSKDPDFYKKIGRIGGAASGTGGFAANHELARIAGRKGGLATQERSHTRKKFLGIF